MYYLLKIKIYINHLDKIFNTNIENLYLKVLDIYFILYLYLFYLGKLAYQNKTNIVSVRAIS